MAFQPVPSTAEFEVRMVGPAPQDIISSIHVRNTVLGWPAARVSAVATTIGNAWRDQVMPLLTTVVTLDKVEGRDLGTEFGAQATVEYNTPGSAGVLASPLYVAALVQLTGAAGAPPRRGSMFVGGLDESASSGDFLTAPFQAALLAAVNAIDAAITGGGDAWVIVSRFSKTANPVPPHLRPQGLTNTITARNIRPLVAVMKKRRAGTGS